MQMDSYVQTEKLQTRGGILLKMLEEIRKDLCHLYSVHLLE